MKFVISQEILQNELDRVEYMLDERENQASTVAEEESLR